jgi:hypothetical protein
MDLFPDFNELGTWGYIVPLLGLLAVVVPIWNLSRRGSQTSIQSRIMKTTGFTAVALIVLCILLIAIGGIVFRISNPSLL